MYIKYFNCPHCGMCLENQNSFVCCENENEFWCHVCDVVYIVEDDEVIEE